MSSLIEVSFFCSLFDIDGIEKYAYPDFVEQDQEQEDAVMEEIVLAERISKKYVKIRDLPCLPFEVGMGDIVEVEINGDKRPVCVRQVSRGSKKVYAKMLDEDCQSTDIISHFLDSNNKKYIAYKILDNKMLVIAFDKNSSDDLIVDFMCKIPNLLDFMVPKFFEDDSDISNF